jgi:hypothetical protein
MIVLPYQNNQDATLFTLYSNETTVLCSILVRYSVRLQEQPTCLVESNKFHAKTASTKWIYQAVSIRLR